MAIVTIAESDPTLLAPPTSFVPIGSYGGTATEAVFTLDSFGFGGALGSIVGVLVGTGFTYPASDPNGLPVTGQITSIEIIYDSIAFGDTLLHTVTFPAPIDALAFRATNFDLTALLYGGADSMLGAAGDDRLAAHGGNDTIRGGGGQDTIDGGAGADSLFGEGGQDSILGGLGTDVLDGGSGNDTLVGGDEADTLTGGDGDDSLVGGDGTDLLRLAQGVDRALGGAGADTILVTDTGGFASSPEADVLDGGGGAGVDMLRIAASGNTFLYGATLTGLEALRIESGTAWLNPQQVVAFSNPLIGVALATGAGTTATLGVIGAGAVDLQGLNLLQTTAAGLQLLLSGSGAAGFTVNGRSTGAFINDNVFGSQNSDSITGRDGNDTLNGSGGNDTVLGGNGADYLAGSAGDDTLNGGAGADTVGAGAGADTLTGGSDADRFVFTGQDIATQGQTDRITDFSRAAGDLIDLAGIDANALVAGDQAFSAPGILSGGASPPPAGSLRYVVGADHTMLYLYTDSDAAEDFSIRVNGTGYTPVAADFVL